jgi:hypothetical protein
VAKAAAALVLCEAVESGVIAGSDATSVWE